jgi:hypothetical protein
MERRRQQRVASVANEFLSIGDQRGALVEDERRYINDNQERDASQFLSSRDPSELLFDEFEIVADRVRALDLDRAADRLDDTGEFDQKACHPWF